MHRKTADSSSGAAHVLSLVVLAIIAVIVARYTASVRQSLYIQEMISMRDRATGIAESGLALAIDHLVREYGFVLPQDSMWFEFNDSVSSIQPISKSRFLSSIAADSFNYCLVTDEAGKANMNFIGYDQIRCIPGVSDRQAAAIADWLDSDHQPGEGGAESESYRILGRKHDVKNAFLESMEELLLIDGAASINLGELSSSVTVYGDGALNINTCSEGALRITGFSDSFARGLVAGRDGPDLLAGTADDLTFNANNLAVQLSHVMAVNALDRNVIRRLMNAGRVSFRSDCLRFRVQVGAGGSGPQTSIQTVVTIDDCGDLQILYWREI
ncbi:MAG: hypothetical protein ABIK83_06630 [Candidatus Zixiibacteriota bacterium]